jgi:hypothetical protein
MEENEQQTIAYFFHTFRIFDLIARFAQVGLVELILRASHYGWSRA